MYLEIPFLYRRLRERLWVRPVIFCILAILALLAAGATDRLGLEDVTPNVEHDTVEKLLSIISASMLGVATFAVASMVAAYASVSSNATPRAFALVISDDVSKTVLSTFIAAFIFSVVALIAIKAGYYRQTALFAVFVMTIAILAWVVFSFVRWVDQIARLGRLETTIDRVEKATTAALDCRRRSPSLGALLIEKFTDPGEPIFSDEVGYVQHINVGTMQSWAEKHDAVLTVAALPGTFIAPGRALVFVKIDVRDDSLQPDQSALAEAFVIGSGRVFDDDPRFGLITLSEIAARALSPGVNDPGTAISIIGTFVRLFVCWASPLQEDEKPSKPQFDRVRVPLLSVDDMFDDAFTAIARDGAGEIEVVVRLQKAFKSLCAIGNDEISAAASRHSKIAMARAELELKLPYETEAARALADNIH